jgi:hypothetical protein
LLFAAAAFLFVDLRGALAAVLAGDLVFEILRLGAELFFHLPVDHGRNSGGSGNGSAGAQQKRTAESGMKHGNQPPIKVLK